MAEAQTYYDYQKRLTWSFTREQIGCGLRKCYQLPEELPPDLHALVRKLDTAESNQFRHSGMMTDYARSSGVKAFPEWFVRT